MRNWRVVTAIAAVVLAVVTGILVWKYVDQARRDAKRPYQPVAALVAREKIPGGTPFERALDSKLIEVREVSRKDLPDARIPVAANAVLRSAYTGRVAAHDLAKDLPLVLDDFVAPNQLVSSLVGQIGKGDEAITVSLDDTHAVGGFVSPGDKVNVIVTLDMTDLTTANSKTLKTSTFLIPGLKVLAVGSTTVVPQPTPSTSGAQSTQVQARGLLTFEVTPHQALQIAQASAKGQIYLSLNPSDFSPGEFQRPEEIVEAVNLFDQPLNKLNDVFNQLRNVK